MFFDAKFILKTLGLAVLAWIMPGFAQEYISTYQEGVSGQLEFGFSTPETMDSGEVYPLIMYLHGYSNNYAVYLQWYDSAFQAKVPSFVYTPRTPTTWGDWSGWWTDLSEPMTVAMQVLDSLIAIYPIDTNRLYVYGISMGGEGVFDLLDKKPGFFAAAMSVCGGGRPAWAENVAQTPFWMFHGSADAINPVSLTEDVADSLEALGATQWRFTRYEGYGHDIWDRAAQEPSWEEWMFVHARGEAQVGPPAGSLQLQGEASSDGTFLLSWNDLRDYSADAPDSQLIWYYRIEDSQGLVGTTEYNQTSYKFTPSVSPDTFQVVAVNLHFAQSVPSNAVAYVDSASAIQSNHQNAAKSSPSRQQIRLYDLLGRFYGTRPSSLLR